MKRFGRFKHCFEGLFHLGYSHPLIDFPAFAKSAHFAPQKKKAKKITNKYPFGRTFSMISKCRACGGDIGGGEKAKFP